MTDKIEALISGSGFPEEFRIILWAISGKGHSVLPKSSVFESVKGDDLIRLAQNHGVLTVLYMQLKTLNEALIPENILSRLKDIYLQIVRFNMIQANQLIKALDLLYKNGIEAIPIKGPVISQQAYGDIGFRMFNDLDLMILPENFIQAYDVLCHEGYEPSLRLSKKKRRYWKRSRRDMELRIGKTMIDLHQRFSQGNSSFDIIEEQIKRVETIEILDKKIKVLSVEDTIIYLCINGTKDNWNKLRMVSDLSHLVRSNPDLKWDKVILQLKKRGMLGMVLSGLKFMSIITGEMLPDIINSEIKTSKRVKVLSEKHLSNAFSEFPDKQTPSIVRSLARSMDSITHKIRFLVYYFFTPGSADLRAIKIPDILFPLYYLLRPLRLFVNALIPSKRKQEQ